MPNRPIAKPADSIRDVRHIRGIKHLLKARDQRLEYLYFTVAMNSGLRVGDMLRLRVDDLWDAGNQPRPEFMQHPEKTGAFVITRINKSIQEAMRFAAPAFPLHEPEVKLFPMTRQTVSNWLGRWW